MKARLLGILLAVVSVCYFRLYAYSFLDDAAEAFIFMHLYVDSGDLTNVFGHLRFVLPYLFLIAASVESCAALFSNRLLVVTRLSGRKAYAFKETAMILKDTLVSVTAYHLLVYAYCCIGRRISFHPYMMEVMVRNYLLVYQSAVLFALCLNWLDIPDSLSIALFAFLLQCSIGLTGLVSRLQYQRFFLPAYGVFAEGEFISCIPLIMVYALVSVLLTWLNRRILIRKGDFA